jgi:hypothetical protein
MRHEQETYRSEPITLLDTRSEGGGFTADMARGTAAKSRNIADDDLLVRCWFTLDRVPLILWAERIFFARIRNAFMEVVSS